MKNAKTVEKLTNKLLDLIVRYNHDGEDDVIQNIYNQVEKIYLQDKVGIEDVLTVMVDKTNNLDDIMLFKSVCEDVSSILYINGQDKETYEASLFLVPIMYVAQPGQELNTIDRADPNYTKLAKTFKKSGLFSKETDVYLHNRLYGPHELLNTSYSDVFNMTQALASYAILGQNNLQALDLGTPTTINNDTLMIKYMLGIKINNKDEAELTEDEKEIAFGKFVKLSNPYISKLLGMDDYNILEVESFYKGFQTGLDVYFSSARRLKIYEALKEHDISPRGTTAVISLIDEETQNSSIELISKLTTDTLCIINFDTFNFHTTEENIALIASDLEASGLKQEDLFVKWQNKVKPYLSLLASNKTMPVDVNEFMISNTRKATLH